MCNAFITDYTAETSRLTSEANKVAEKQGGRSKQAPMIDGSRNNYLRV